MNTIILDNKALWNNLYDAKKKVEGNIQSIDALNSKKNCNILSKCNSEIQNELEHLKALHTAQNSKINAFAKGCFKMLGGSLGLVALGLLQIPLTILTCLDRNHLAILPGYSTLASMVREGAFSFMAAFRDKNAIEEEIGKRTDAINSQNDNINSFL